jgi:peroxiredoxin Q/BCP
MLEVGTSAPAFSLLDHNSEQVSLDEFAGQWLLFWWYPKASTPG